MNDEELKGILERQDIPDLGEAARERIVTAAVRRYRQAEATPAASVRFFRDWLAPALAVAACMVVIVAAQYARSPAASGDQYNVAVFQEYQSLFQYELRAVVARNGDVDVVLGGAETEQSNPVVLIRIEAGGEPVYITAYSGQTIEAEIGGKTVTMDILTTTDQDVLVAADDFMIENDVMHGPDNLFADAHVVETGL